MDTTQNDWLEWAEVGMDPLQDRLEVLDIETQEVVINNGELWTYTDILGAGGILQRGKYGLSDHSVVLALKFPKNRPEFQEWQKRYRFRIFRAVKKENAKMTPVSA